MLDFFRDRLTADAILDYLDHLPRTSAYHSAIADDEELAKRLAREPVPESKAPPLTEFSPEVQVLAEVRDLLASLVAVTVKVNNGNPGRVKPYPRPETAVERERHRQRYQNHRSLAARVLRERRPHT